MKILPLLSACILGAFIVGCTTTTERPVASVPGPGTKRIYAAPFDQTWVATESALRRSNLAILSSDRSIGYVEARRSNYPREYSETVRVWVRSIAPMQTEVEIADRQAGPPVLALVDRELQIHDAIATNLRDMAAVRTPVREREVIIDRSTAPAITVERRDALQREVDRLREDIRLQQRRLEDLERELR